MRHPHRRTFFPDAFCLGASPYRPFAAEPRNHRAGTTGPLRSSRGVAIRFKRNPISRNCNKGQPRQQPDTTRCSNRKRLRAIERHPPSEPDIRSNVAAKRHKEILGVYGRTCLRSDGEVTRCCGRRNGGRQRCSGCGTRISRRLIESDNITARSRIESRVIWELLAHGESYPRAANNERATKFLRDCKDDSVMAQRRDRLVSNLLWGLG